MTWSVLAYVVCIDHGAYLEVRFNIQKPRPDFWCLQGRWFQETPESTIPTLTRPQPRSKPLRNPAGLDVASEEAKARWTKDNFAQQVYFYETKNMVCIPEGEFVTLSHEERALLMGVDLHYVEASTSNHMSKKFRENHMC